MISERDSTRRPDLIQAANATQLDLMIPELRPWTTKQASNRTRHARVHSGKDMASSRAWRNHSFMLKQFLKSPLQTALIMEESVEWDVLLRTDQIPHSAAALHSILPPADVDLYPWGHPDDWDLLYLGHCGDLFQELHDVSDRRSTYLEDLTRIPHVMYADTTMPDRSEMHYSTASLLINLQIPEKTRIIHKSRFPACTLGYAITRSAARRIVEEIYPDTNDEEAPSYDISIREACRARDFRCYTVNPELLHKKEPN